MAAGDASLQLTITAVDSASNIIGNIGRSLASLAGDGMLGAVVTGAIAAGTAIVGIGASAATAAGNFQQSMEQLVTSAGESQSSIQMLSDGLLKMSVDTGTTTQQLASGMYYVESAGTHGAAALSEMQVAAEGAKSENADLTTVTKALTTVLTDYNANTSDAAHATASSTAVMNGLIATVQNGKTNLQELSSSMGAILPIASSLGISYSQVAGTLDTMTNAGVPAQQAAQNLAHVFLAFSAPSKVAISSMQGVGLSAQQVKDALVSQGLPGALQLIEDHIGQKFPAGSYQAELALKNITGGIMGFKEAAMLTGPALQTAENDIKKIATAMGDASNGVLGWDIVQTEFNFKLDQAKNAFSALMVTLGEKLLPLLTPLVAGFTSFVTTLTSWVQGIDDGTVSGNILVRILTSLGVNSKTAEQIFADLTTTFHILWLIISDVGNVLSRIFGGALQVVGNLVQDFVNGPLDGIIQGFNLALSYVSGFTDQLNQVIDVIGSILGSLGSTAFDWGANMMVGFENGVVSIINDIISVVEQVAQEIANYLGFASPTKKGPGSTLNSWGQGMMSGLAQGILDNIPMVTDAVQSVAGQFGMLNGSSGETNQPSASRFFTDKLSGDLRKVTITPTLVTKSASLQSVGSTMASSLASGLTAGTGSVQRAVQSVGKQLHAVCKQHAQSTSSCAADALTQGLASKLHAGKSSVSSAANAVGSGLSGPGKVAAQAAAKAAAAAKAQDAANARAATMNAEWQKAMSESSSAAVQSLVQKSQQEFAKGNTAMASFYARQALQLAAQEQAANKKAAAAAAKLGPAPVAGATGTPDILGGTAITKALEPIKKAATDASQSVTQALGPAATFVKQAWSSVGTFFSQLGTTLTNTWKAMLPGLQDIWRVIQTQLLPALKGLWDTVSPLVVGIGKLALALLAGVDAFIKWITQSNTLMGIWNAYVAVLKLVISVISTLVGSFNAALGPVVQQIITSFQTQLLPAFQNLWSAIQTGMPFLKVVGELLADVFVVAEGIVLGVLGGLLKAIGNFFSGLIMAVSGIIQLISGLLQIVIGIGQLIYDAATGNFGKLGKDLGVIWQGIQDTWHGLWTAIWGIVWSGIGYVIGLVDGFVHTFIGFFQNLYNALVGHSIIPDLVNGILGWFTRMGTGLSSIVSSTVSWIWNTFAAGFSNLITNVGTWATNMMSMFGNMIRSGYHFVTDAIQSLGQAIANVFGFHSPPKEGPLSESDRWMPNMLSMWGTGIERNAHKVTGPLGDLATQMGEQVSALQQQSGSQLVNNFVAGMRTHTPLLLTEANRLGERLQASFAPTIQSAFALPQNSPNAPQKADIQINMDGKPIMKAVGVYIGREVRIQGNIRGV